MHRNHFLLAVMFAIMVDLPSCVDDTSQGSPDAGTCPTCEELGRSCGPVEITNCEPLNCGSCEGTDEACIDGLCQHAPCDGTPLNACGTCSVLSGPPNVPCGTCGYTACVEDAIACVDDHPLDVCGGCSGLMVALDDVCNTCGGTWTCLGTELVCEGGNDLNACGGCGTLSTEPGQACPCGDTTVTCEPAGWCPGVGCEDRNMDVTCRHISSDVNHPMELPGASDWDGWSSLEGRLEILEDSTLGPVMWARAWVEDTAYANFHPEVRFTGPSTADLVACVYFRRENEPQWLLGRTYCDGDWLPSFASVELEDGTRFSGCCKYTSPTNPEVEFGIHWLAGPLGSDSGWVYFRVSAQDSYWTDGQCAQWNLDYRF